MPFNCLTTVLLYFLCSFSIYFLLALPSSTILMNFFFILVQEENQIAGKKSILIGSSFLACVRRNLSTSNETRQQPRHQELLPAKRHIGSKSAIAANGTGCFVPHIEIELEMGREKDTNHHHLNCQFIFYNTQS